MRERTKAATVARLQRAEGKRSVAYHWSLYLSGDDGAIGSLEEAKARAALRVRRAERVRDELARRAGMRPCEYGALDGSVQSWMID